MCVYVIISVAEQDGLFSSQEILYCYGETMSTVGVISKVFGYLDRTPERQREGELAPQQLKGGVVFQNVTFKYPSEKPQESPAALKVTVSYSVTVLNINIKVNKPQEHHFIMNVFCSVSFYRAEAGEDDGPGGALRQWEEFLCQPPEEAVRTSRGRDPAGRRTAAPLRTQILPSKGAAEPMKRIKSHRNDPCFAEIVLRNKVSRKQKLHRI